MGKMAPRLLLCATALVTLAGCTGSITPFVGDDPSAAATASSPPTATSATGRVLSVQQLPFPAPPGSALPATRQQALQDALDRAVRDSTQLVGVTAAVVSTSGSWTGSAGVDGAGARLVPEAMMAIALDHEDGHRRGGRLPRAVRSDQPGRACVELPRQSAVATQSYCSTVAFAHQRCS